MILKILVLLLLEEFRLVRIRDRDTVSLMLSHPTLCLLISPLFDFLILSACHEGKREIEKTYECQQHRKNFYKSFVLHC